MELNLRTYKGRFFALCTVAALLVAVLWKQRLANALDRWRAHRDLDAQVIDRTAATDQLARSRAAAIGLQAALGDINAPAEGTWQAVLTAIGARSTLGVRLHRVEAGTQSVEAGTELHLLPITLAGSYPGLLRAANAVQRAVPDAHVVSMRFHTERTGYGRPRELLLTLYFQKIVRHG